MRPLQFLALLVTILTVFDSSSSFDAFVPVGQELIYDYQGTLSAGTPFPVPFASQFVLKGKLHVQSNKIGSIQVLLSNLTSTLYNGPTDALPSSEIHEVDLPNEAKNLQEVFEISYDAAGTLIGINFGANDKEFIRNIKKSIASLLQLNPEVVVTEEGSKVFRKEEQSLYGKQLASYIVTRKSNNIEVEKNYPELKVYDENSLRFFPNTFESSPVCEVPVADPLVNNVSRNYRLKIENNATRVEEITSQGSIFYNPFESNSDSKFVKAIHILKLVRVAEIEEYLPTKLTYHDGDLSYFVVDESVEPETLPDFTNGRSVVDFKKLNEAIDESIQYIAQHFDMDHLISKTPDIVQVSSTIQLLRALRYFDVKKLEELHQSLLKKPAMLHIFYEVLPHVGSKASVLLIKKFVVEKIVGDGIATNLLQKFPDFTVMPSRNLVAELEEFFRLNNTYDWDVRNVAILSFGAIVDKARNYEEKKLRAAGNHDENVENYYDKFVTEYVTMIRDGEDYKVKLAFLQGLSNMKMQRALELLQPALDGDWWQCRVKFMHWQNCHHLRFQVMFSLSSIVVGKSSLATYELYLPILANRHEHPELRIAAFYFIMESKPNPSILYNLLSIIQKEEDLEAYRFYYSYVNFNKDSVDPCHDKFKQGLRHIFKQMKRPAEGVSNAFLTDYFDAKFGFGVGLEVVTAATDASRIYVLTGKGRVGRIYNQNGVFVKLYGLQNLKIENVESLQEFNKFLRQPINNIKIEVVLFNHERFLNSYVIEEHNLIQLDLILKQLFRMEELSIRKELMKIDYQLSSSLLIPNDLGMPTVFEYVFPMIHKYNVSFDADLRHNLIINCHFESSYRNLITHRSGFTFYNPIVDIWHGIHRVNTMNYVASINGFNILVNFSAKSMKISWNKNKDEFQNVAGIRTHATTMTFLRDDFRRKKYSPSCSRCKAIEIASRGEDHRHLFTLVQNQMTTIGHKWQVEIFDAEGCVTNGTVRQQFNTFLQPATKNFETYTDRVILAMNHFYTYATFLPDPGTYGLLVRLEPVQEVNNIDLEIQFNEESDEDHVEFLSPLKWTTRATYSVNSVNQSLQTWILNALIETNTRQTRASYKFDLSRKFLTQDVSKFCVIGEYNWKQEGLFGHTNVAIGKTNEDKCDKEPIITVDMKGEKSGDEDGFHKCLSLASTIKCLGLYNSVRNYTYLVKTGNLPKEIGSIFETFWIEFKEDKWNYYYEYPNTNKVDDYNLLINVFYPVQGNKVDFAFAVGDRQYEFKSVPKKLQWTFLQEGLQLHPKFRETYRRHLKNQFNYCYILSNHESAITESTPKNWTLYLANTIEEPNNCVYVKKMENNKISVKIVFLNRSIKIIPNHDDFQILKEVPSYEKTLEEWVFVEKFRGINFNKIVVLVPYSGIYLEHGGNDVVLAVPKDKKWHGKCFPN